MGLAASGPLSLSSISGLLSPASLALGRVRWSLAPEWDFFGPGESTWRMLVPWGRGASLTNFPGGDAQPRYRRVSWEAWVGPEPGLGFGSYGGWGPASVPRCTCAVETGAHAPPRSAAPRVPCRRSCGGRCRRRGGAVSRACSSLTKRRSCTRSCWSCLDRTWKPGSPRPRARNRHAPSSSFSGEV